MDSVWFTPPVIAAIVSSGVAALAGGYFGALLKEYFGDKYTKKRRLREIRKEVFKNVGLFYNIYQSYARLTSQKEITLAMAGSMRNYKREKEFFKEARSYDREIADYYGKCQDFWATLNGLGYECQDYINENRYNAFKELTRELRANLDSKLSIKKNFPKNMAEISKYLAFTYDGDLMTLYKLQEELIDHFVHEVNEVVQEK